ncbi:hypothetical protein N7548_02685 [Acholeplasma manati]|uniref:Uncharacterized protein n=1 Tax=Paracholeplasma manati TaxID=591373 RepID=A0ABT2Y4R2_9MOLU|nr:hypothetical protein [Paracholeplasma manati]MCV2231725.1 hypothetical protein [Paracholeplasma manati]
MNKWYEDLLDYLLDLGDPNISFKPITETRDDFQSKIIDLAVNIKLGYYGKSEQHITALITAIDTMKPIEVAIFLLIVSEYYYQTDDYFKAADLLKIIIRKEFVHVKINLWLHEQLFKLSLCSKNEHYVSKIFHNLQKMYLTYNLYGKSTEKRMEYIKYCAYIMDERFFKDLLSFDHHIEHQHAQLLQLFLCQKLSLLKQSLEPFTGIDRFDLLFALYHHEMKQENLAKAYVEKLVDHAYDSPIEAFYKGYLKAYYVTKQSDIYLKGIIGNQSKLFFHSSVIEIASKYYIDFLTDAHRYKDCTVAMKLANAHLNNIQKNLEIF